MVMPPAQSDTVLAWSVPAISAAACECFVHGVDVRVETPVPVLLGRVAPADGEHLECPVAQQNSTKLRPGDMSMK